MSNTDPLKHAGVTVTYVGDNVRDLVKRHTRVISSIWEACTGLLDATVVVYVSDRQNEAERLEWPMTVTSLTGRRHLTVTQRRAEGSVLISDN